MERGFLLNKWVVAYIILRVLDIATSYVGIAVLGYREGNIFIRHLLRYFGWVPTIVINLVLSYIFIILYQYIVYLTEKRLLPFIAKIQGRRIISDNVFELSARIVLLVVFLLAPLNNLCVILRGVAT
ncbi:MAG: hypothetical protein QXZ50_00970 [Ignisphaera sp.]